MKRTSEQEKKAGMLTIWLVLFCLVSTTTAAAQETRGEADGPIDRHALVTRHNPILREASPFNPLSVGNGTFVFTADITGLQSFPDFYLTEDPSGLPGTIPLVTQAEWGWHTFPNPQGFRLEDNLVMYSANGREVGYASEENTPAGQWLRQNPHKLNLGQIGFQLFGTDGNILQIHDLENSEQSLDLWSGTLTSSFEIEGKSVRVETVAHPEVDMISVRIQAPELDAGQLRVRFAFPYGSGEKFGDASDWDHPDRHSTTIVDESPTGLVWERKLDKDRYYVGVRWPAGSTLEKHADHEYILSFSGFQDGVAFEVGFSKERFSGSLPDADATREASRRYWGQFWNSGGAIDLSGSTDPRARELERRIVLSQYLTAIQCAGTQPPQESGLTFNSWYGKFHLEMHWWHAVHFALWDRLPLLEKSLGWYEKILPEARKLARRQGYSGARWPKMVGPEGHESPSGIAVFLIWQQPHPIYYAELVYRSQPNRKTLERLSDIVFETAEFMASYPIWDEEGERYMLGPPLIPAQEIHPPRTTYNPTFELAYWRFGLETAQQWRERLDLPRNENWDHVLDRLSNLPVQDGLYVNTESSPETFTDAEHRRDHPTLLGACGMLPCDYVDPEIMKRTLDRVMDTWNWDHTWGWDYPLVAMTAARLGKPETAVDALLMETVKNTYLPNGHNYQREGLATYLPGNGGLLTAVAMMAAGWDGAPDVHAPGFPKNGQWVVRWEGLKRMP